MSDLSKDCLSRLPMLPEDVQRIYDRMKNMDQFSAPVRWIKELCLSHERLRAELHGAEILLSELQEQEE